jgi:fumarate hydratase subunit beta
MNEIHSIRPPLDETTIMALRAGDRVRISGILYTARDAAHARIAEAVRTGEPLPFDPTGQIIFYAGPTPAPPGRPVGSIGPTTSSRMDSQTPMMLSLGVKGFIGKGSRSNEVCSALQENKAVYFLAVGGIAAVLSQCVRSARCLAYAELGTEAIWELDVENFPVITGCDAFGGDLFHR